MKEDVLRKMLSRPMGPIDCVLDTDAYNEIDDQFAIAYMLSAKEKLNVRAIFAAPFANAKASRPDEGMEKSYDEILKILRLANQSSFSSLVYRGSTRYLPDENTPVDSPAARQLAEMAMAYTSERPLYVVAIGAITNVASALLMQPDMRERVVVVWLGGHAHHWQDTYEFNMLQDVAAARVVFGSGVPLVQLPCQGVVSELTTTGPELTYWLAGKNALCDYLAANTIAEAESYAAGRPWSRVIWDVSAVAWLLDEAGQTCDSRLVPAPIPQYDHHYSFSPDRHLIRYVYRVHRNLIFGDLFSRLTRD